MTHTPGPWKLHRWFLGWHVSAPSQNGTEHAVTVAEMREAPLGKLYAHQCQANATMVFAAPDLLAACKAALAYDAAIQRHSAEHAETWTEGDPPVWAEGDDLDKLYADWIDKSRAAIAKAEGG